MNLRSVRLLTGLFIVMILSAAAFQLMRESVGGLYLDMIPGPEAARALISGLTPEQRLAHVRVTLLLDTVFPFSFGLLFAGMALRLHTSWGMYLALPSVAAILLDLSENLIQLLALTGSADFLGAKALITPAKFALAGLGGAIALVSLIAGLPACLRRTPG